MDQQHLLKISTTLAQVEKDHKLFMEKFDPAILNSKAETTYMKNENTLINLFNKAFPSSEKKEESIIPPSGIIDPLGPGYLPGQFPPVTPVPIEPQQEGQEPEQPPVEPTAPPQPEEPDQPETQEPGITEPETEPEKKQDELSPQVQQQLLDQITRQNQLAQHIPRTDIAPPELLLPINYELDAAYTDTELFNDYCYHLF